MRELLKKDSEDKWTSSHQKSLEQIKSIISTEMLLTYFDPLKTSVIQVGTSSQGLGVALIQESKPLTETEQCYANIEEELLAVVKTTVNSSC